jgi:competence protein ComEC
LIRNILPQKIFLSPVIIIVVFLSLSGTVSVRADQSGPSAGQPPLRVHFIDVGYGDAVLIEFPDASNMLIDAGSGDFAPHLMAYLRKKNVRRMDAVMITHPHENHFGGLNALVQEIPIRHFFHNGEPEGEEGYAALLEQFKQRRIPIDVVRTGQKMDVSADFIAVEILHPRDLKGSTNDNSIVAWLKYKKTSILFLADIESAQQEVLLHEWEGIRDADCVKVPHHGGPLSGAFVRAFMDKIFIVSTGPNPWGLPRAEDLQKLRGKIYRTDQEGTIVVESDGVSVRVVP